MKKLRRAAKSLLIGFVALALLFNLLPLGRIPITQVGVPYIGGITRVINTDTSKIEVTLSAGAVIVNADVVIAKVAKVTAVVERPVPAGKTFVGSYAYSLAATHTVQGTAISEFAKNVTVKFTYTDAQIAGLNEAGLTIYRWNETASS